MNESRLLPNGIDSGSTPYYFFYWQAKHGSLINISFNTRGEIRAKTPLGIDLISPENIDSYDKTITTFSLTAGLF